jgi:hypothetical protein
MRDSEKEKHCGSWREYQYVRKQIYSRRENPGGTDMRRRKDECI